MLHSIYYSFIPPLPIPKKLSKGMQSNKKITKRDLKLRAEPLLINADIQKLMRYRDKYFKKIKSNPSSSNKYVHHKFRNRVVSEQHRGK